ncbi:PREDICTED: delta(3,5)-Delta(2,4)-dienoyl-CoA isomerase, mitochondrial [Corvus brachyrhynchos]|uniref:delta(3,5)-Delta(2,4)-dienoyl-CoA isomerase, mitochondrial n=1 Tax=Corvus brachyrhynchos TaxID=85066 RepID=UPI0008165276|nr:PREDICTED: delta(3,5)-Delta(2,4)-dienoyl-CoA isomerase, mitochondrial [Corvus brachyrhynchos]
MLGRTGSYWWSVVVSGSQWRSLMVTGGHWWSLAVTGSHWRSLAVTGGIDLSDLGALAGEPGGDVARMGSGLGSGLGWWGDGIGVGIGVGMVGEWDRGVDLISACDIRFCSQDASFQVKVGHEGFPGPSGCPRGPSGVPKAPWDTPVAPWLPRTPCPPSRVLPDKATLLEVALEVAAAIAARSPVAQGTKVNLVYSRDRPVAEGLLHVATWNMAMLQTEDIPKSVQAALDKKGPKDVPFAKL